jgi:hypothetical protein
MTIYPVYTSGNEKVWLYSDDTYTLAISDCSDPALATEITETTAEMLADIFSAETLAGIIAEMEATHASGRISIHELNETREGKLEQAIKLARGEKDKRQMTIVIDPITDATSTAETCQVNIDGRTITVTDQDIIRALYDDPSARPYAEGSYVVDSDLLPRYANYTDEEIANYVQEHEDDGPHDEDALLGMYLSKYDVYPDEDARKCLWSHVCNLA